MTFESSSQSSTSAVAQWLDQHGLLLCAFQWCDLPNSITEFTRNALPEKVASNISESSKLILLANVGPKFWRELQKSLSASKSIEGLNPVDDFSVSMATMFQTTFLDKKDFLQLYPTPPDHSHIPLMRLGALAGWNVPSPLGLGLHPEYGPWSAYRVAWLTESEQLPAHYFIAPNKFKKTNLDTTNPSALQSAAELCVGCDAPCVSACPAAAVAQGENFNTQACHDYRLPTTSECHVHCAARRACPIGKDHQYDNDQLAHHMGMRWRNCNS